MHRNPNSATLVLHWVEIYRLDKIVMELSSDLNSFTHLLDDETPPRTVTTKSVRSKGGLINVLGYGCKDVLRLTKDCDKLHVFEAQVAHSTERQLSYLRSLDDSTGQKTKGIIDSFPNFSLQ